MGRHADAIDEVDGDADAADQDNQLWILFYRVVQGGVPETTELLKWVQQIEEKSKISQT